MKNPKHDIGLYENVNKQYATINFIVKPNMAPPTFRMHWHEEIEIQYIIEGHNIARCDSDIVEVSQDGFYVINSAEIHQSIGGNRRHATIQFSPSLFGKNNVILKRVIYDPYLSELVKKMLIEYEKSDEFSQINIQGYAYLLIAHLYKNHAYKTIDEHTYDSYSERRARINKCIKYMHDNYNKDISLSTLAAMASVSKYHFCNMFKDFTGQTFKEYQNNIRISKAVELLSTTDIPITEIAFLCGFNDSNYFTRKFHQIVGKTPLAAREDSKKQ